MATWTTTAIAERYLPTGYADVFPSGVTLSGLIVEASEDCQTELEPRYWPFPDVDASGPKTPGYIKTTVGYLAAHKALVVIGRRNEIEDDGNAANMYGLYRQNVDALMADEPRAQIPTVRITNEALTFESGEPLLDSEHILVPGVDGFEVIQETVEVSGHKRGSHFEVEYMPEHRRWIFRRRTSDITDSDTVSYSYSYLRRREVDKPVARFGVELVRA